MRVLVCFKMALLILLCSCGVKDYSKLPMYSGNHLIQAVVEIPAGTNHQIQYCTSTHRFDIGIGRKDQGTNRFLPYPFNIGFIPSTLIEDGHDDRVHPIPVILLSEALKTGDVIEIIPLGILTINYEKGLDRMIVAVPYSKEKKIIDATNTRDLTEKYKGLMAIIEEWFKYADPEGGKEMISWQDEVLAMKLIETWEVK